MFEGTDSVLYTKSVPVQVLKRDLLMFFAPLPGTI